MWTATGGSQPSVGVNRRRFSRPRGSNWWQQLTTSGNDETGALSANGLLWSVLRILVSGHGGDQEWTTGGRMKPQLSKG